MDIAGSPFLMTPLSWVGTPDDYVAGRTYAYSTTLPQSTDYSYYFYAEDSTTLMTQTATLPGPLVTLSGDPPVLDWTGEANFVSDGLDPQMGDITVTFEYRIEYSDVDNDAPGGGWPVVHILDGGMDIAGSPFLMTPLSWVGTPAGSPFLMTPLSWVGTPGDYMTGRRYSYSSMLPIGADYTYYFHTEDIVGWTNLTMTLPGPIVTPVNNDPPEAWNLTVDGHSPGSAGILHITSAFPTYAWSYTDPEAQGQTDYQIRVGTAPGLSDVWSPGPAGGPGLSVVHGGGPLMPGFDVYFGVRVMDDAQWSPWNETFFHVNAFPPAPTAPVNPPDTGSVVAGGGTTVQWTSGGPDMEGDAVTYYWEVSTDAGFSWIAASGSTMGNLSDGFMANASTTYYWRVNATDGFGFSAHGNTPPGYWRFDTTAATNDPPTASFPGVDGHLNGTAGIMHVLSAAPGLNWTYNDSMTPQTEYEIMVGTQSGFNDMWATGITAGAATSVAYGGSPLADGTDYYFAVRVSDGTKWSNWTEAVFHMNAPPAVPTLVSPDNGTTDVIPGSLELDWSTAADPDGDSVTYYWYLSDQTDFSPMIDSGSTGSTFESTTVEPTTTYYWKVEAYDGYELSGNSTVFEFTTVADTGTITGTVLDNDTGVEIADATVELLDSSDTVIDTATTDANGDFSFTDLDFDTYSVRVTASGYTTHVEADVEISSHVPVHLDIGLTAKVEEELDWMLILILLLIVIIIIVVLMIVLLKRRKKPEEAPPAGQPPAYHQQPPQEAPPQQPEPQGPPEQPPPAEPPQPVEPAPQEPPAEGE
jgi:hypothetical protein